MLRYGNLFEAVPDELAVEEFAALVEGGGVRIERIVSTGQRSPEGFWYNQDQDEWVVVLKGHATLEMEGDEAGFEMKPGDWILIPARHRHRVAATADDKPTVWLAVHFDEVPCPTSDVRRLTSDV